MTTTSPSWFDVPRPIHNLFKLFPLQVYAAEPLPARAPGRNRRRAQLYVFASEEGAVQGLPSYNPTCLKWQTYLRIAGLDIDIIPSTNHASPSGSLPYLLPESSDSRSSIPLTGEKISQYAQKYTSIRDRTSPRVDVYLSLLAQSVRPAWLHTLYINPSHTTLLSNLYLPSSPLLRTSLLHTLRSAATSEILKTTRRPLLQPAQLYRDAKTAFATLSTLLGANEWFFGAEEPGLFDAEVFAYTYLILDDSLGWKDDTLARCVANRENLVEHRKRLYERCWG
ncbi:hypothetical protein QQS21_008190 [Conoideocrella luteorostrata]|uniref:Mitochondrial outer membrane protein n=1 Tax=Conoideocrella luteorostrata TaxID=1105319 RepID=A0AAJ0FRN0_9HYPO|nr:hypothetical protein QQS21_008190 [Conoideocrella luteorostrata]